MGLELATQLEASLRDFGSSASVELRKNGGRVAVFSTLSWEVRGAAQKPLLHLWSEQHNLTRRVLAITEHIHLPLQAADYWLRVRRVVNRR